MTDTILIDSGSDITIQDHSSILIDAPPAQVTLDPAPMVVVQNNQPKIEIYLHGPPGPKGDPGDQGPAGSVAILEDVLFTLPLADREVLQYRTGPAKWINSSTIDGGNM